MTPLSGFAGTRRGPLPDALASADFATAGDSTLAEGILDRIIHRAHRIELRGESMRKNPPQEPER